MTIKVLKDGTQWTKANYWEGSDLKGDWLATYKIDGVRCIRGADGKVYSRDSKPILHCDEFDFNDAEFFYKNWNTSISVLHTQEKTLDITRDMFYNLDPIDKRLVVAELNNPSKEFINDLLQDALDKGYEGLVLRQGDKWLKVVPTKYADIRIQNILPGRGKYKGMAGSIVTSMGRIGSFELQGLMSDTEFRTHLWNNKEQYIGKIIQVAYRELTVNKQFKFPRLVRIRTDKDYEDLPIQNTKEI